MQLTKKYIFIYLYKKKKKNQLILYNSTKLNFIMNIPIVRYI